MDESVHEEWRDVVGYEGIYSVSNLGRVRRQNASASKDLGWTNGAGYRHVILCDGTGGRSCRKIHRLVLEAFCGTALNKNQVNHKNGIKTDNQLKNLEWCTNKENSHHAWKLGLITPSEANRQGEANPFSKLTEVLVEKILDEYTNTDASIGDLSVRIFGNRSTNNYSLIYKLVTRRRWTHVPCDEAALKAAHKRKRNQDRKKPRKVTADIAAAIRREHTNKRTHNTIAQQYGIARDTVLRVVNRKGRYANL